MGGVGSGRKPGRPLASLLVDCDEIRDFVQELLKSYKDKMTLMEIDFCRRIRADNKFTSERARVITQLFDDVSHRSSTWAEILKRTREDYKRIDKEREKRILALSNCRMDREPTCQEQ